jgi:sensor histidine kinase YesM
MLVLSLIAFAFYLSYENRFYVEPYLTYYKIFFCLFCLILCYLNMYVLVPRFLFNGKTTLYRLCFLGMVVGALVAVIISQMIFKSFDQRLYTRTIFIPPIISNVFIATVFLGTSTAIKLFQQRIRDTERISELTSAGLQSELEQLKNQINPHFLFNMLNNANVLTQKDPEKASQVLMKLSDLLRYQLYDSARDRVLLSTDIRFLQDSLDLEKVRRDHFVYTVSQEGNISGIQIPPFLFITFVENAIKHSLSSESPSYIDIAFKVEKKCIDFTCINSRPPVMTNKGVGGLGLKNVRRRLELLFPGTHTLAVAEQDDRYVVNLNIEL